MAWRIVGYCQIAVTLIQRAKNILIVERLDLERHVWLESPEASYRRRSDTKPKGWKDSEPQMAFASSP